VSARNKSIIMPQKFLTIWISSCFFLLPFQANAAPDKAVPQAPVAQQAVAKSSPITQAAVQYGVLACTSRINQVASFLTANTVNGAFLSFSPAAPDQHIFSASLEIIPPKNPSVYASTSFTPTPNGGCDAVYDTVQYAPGTCADVAAKRFKVTGTPGALKKDILMLNAGGAKFFLMPAGKNGCVVIKKEVVQ